MYQALPEQSQKAFTTAAPLLWRTLSEADDHLNMAAFPKHGDQKVGDQHKPGTSFTIGDWLKSIEKPVDYWHVTDDKDDEGRRILQERQGDLDDPTRRMGGRRRPPRRLGHRQVDGIHGFGNGLVVVELRQLFHFARAGGFSVEAMAHLVSDMTRLFDATMQGPPDQLM